MPMLSLLTIENDQKYLELYYKKVLPNKLTSFDIPTQDTIHQYQCNNPEITGRMCVVRLQTSWVMPSQELWGTGE